MNKDYLVVFVTPEIMIPEFGEPACGANFRGGLGILAGDIMEGLAKKNIKALGIAPFYDLHWMTREKISYEKIKKLYEKTYDNSSFIRLVEQSRSSVVAGSNFCDIALYVKGNKLIVTSAIDNLVKGAAGQAIQNMNIMFGLPEITGLQFPGLHPY